MFFGGRVVGSYGSPQNYLLIVSMIICTSVHKPHTSFAPRARSRALPAPLWHFLMISRSAPHIANMVPNVHEETKKINRRRFFFNDQNLIESRLVLSKIIMEYGEGSVRLNTPWADCTVNLLA